MSTLREAIDVKCPTHYLIHHAERYFTVHRRGQAPGKFCLTVDMSELSLPGNVQVRHEVRVFDAILGRKIAAATAKALLQDMKEFIEADYQMALSTTLASSPKE